MSKKILAIVLAMGVASSMPVVGKDCVVSDAKVVHVQKYRDGNIFVSFDKASDCSCQFPSRMAFNQNAGEDFMQAAVLTALTAGKRVRATADDTNCPIHGNTARLTDFDLFAD